jgi:hypothetical protein
MKQTMPMWLVGKNAWRLPWHKYRLMLPLKLTRCGSTPSATPFSPALRFNPHPTQPVQALFKNVKLPNEPKEKNT